MEIKVLESSKTKLVFQLIGADHTFCNALKKELVNTADVEIATYSIEHPQIGIPKMLIQTKKGSPKKALQSALESVKALNKDFVAKFKKAAK